jgi:glycine/D-amino acid oxidase-like deaminating enzyme
VVRGAVKLVGHTRLPVEPLKGELLLAEPSVAGGDVEITWGKFGVYMAAERRIWLGGTEDRTGFDVAPSPSARARILAGVGRLVPVLQSSRIVEQVVGLRPVTPDGLPLVGIPDGWENVCVAVGGGRKGMLLSAGLGLAAAELLTRGDTRVAIDACGLRRPGLVA